MSNKVIVSFKKGTPAAVIDAAAKKIEAAGGKIGHRYNATILGFAAEIPDNHISVLATEPELDFIEADGPVSVAAQQALAQVLAQLTWQPGPGQVKVVETDSEIVIKLDTPGVPKENITVEVHDRVLTIAGEANVDGEKVDGTVHVRERYAGKFERQMALPPAADTDAIKAASVDGILTVTVPKKVEVVEKLQIAVE
ncbi:hypothetical protein AMAG_13741 [Allomyces macrogynus ATCC 38327]|uniref:SHSP domain-containing protein n=1 Tax=Allomyces macrogynus (strain ATCC 38327) TaxID=578462 RepID=A0A0L0T3U1_ALLM3|nr:hypothetical protein AMAG_13741 [Allomyces macrogynus ATCC 38327]|eukprot:KNE69375.1 hypothetical protein AMAG_13741 [Allomyces macrogynus ATCC 38327]